MVRQRTVNPCGLVGLAGSSPVLSSIKRAPVEAVTSTGALLRTAEATRCGNQSIRLGSADFN